MAFLFALLFVSFYIGPIIRVTEKAFAKLEKTTAKALEAARLKSEFLANMSHEIRTPMNGVLGMIELLSRTALDDKQRRYLGTLQTSAGGLMTCSTTSWTSPRSKPARWSCAKKIAACARWWTRSRSCSRRAPSCAACRSTPRSKPTCPRRSRPTPSACARCSRTWSATPSSSPRAVRITVRASVEEYKGQLLQLRFEVKDTGIGIEPALQGKLFEAFSQVDGSLTRKHGGTGLGLAICKQLVALMKGRIGVTSELGKGSTFWFVLPLRRLESTGSLELPSPLERQAARAAAFVEGRRARARSWWPRTTPSTKR